MDEFGLKKATGTIKAFRAQCGTAASWRQRHKDWEASYGSGFCSQGCPTTSSWGPGQDRAEMVPFTSKYLEMPLEKTLLFYYTAEYILMTSLAVQTPTEG